MTPEAAVTKWARVVVAGGWPDGTGDADQVVEVARESLRQRIAVRALVVVLIQKGVLTQADYDTAQSNAADFYDAALTTRFPK